MMFSRTHVICVISPVPFDGRIIIIELVFYFSEFGDAPGQTRCATDTRDVKPTYAASTASVRDG